MAVRNLNDCQWPRLPVRWAMEDVVAPGAESSGSAGHKSKGKSVVEPRATAGLKPSPPKKLARPANQKEDAGMEALSTKDISLEQALLIVGKAIEKAKAIKTKMDI